MNRRGFLTGAIALPLASATPAASIAQVPWPNRNITVIVPFPPGAVGRIGEVE